MRNLMIIMMLFFAPLVYGQQLTVNESNTKLSVDGTSSVHDWTIEAEQFNGKADVKIENNTLQSINSLSFNIPVESLKSGKSGMDDNTYEALKADDHPVIKYEFRSMDNVKVEGNTTTMSTKGALTIGGVTKIVNMNVKANASDGVAFSGDITFKMSVFEIDPPTAVFGTIRTGDQVTIKFNVQYK
ncbi:YceI family protein [Marivirga salinae]|uniref:YceI family protein n=1 Tax=Marivirga salinarum TaxID=3059078 RepID=A0AA51RCY4_9BACT|nr:YceI family protein [Marivirga sp. BDSF4-3]WMN12333.1 YceI family protein [Marivirga sp. BDSF4-3]